MDSPTGPPRPLHELTDDDRTAAMERYAIIADLLRLTRPSRADWTAAATAGMCSVKTIRRWVARFRAYGLAGLVRQERADQGARRVVSPELQRTIEALYLEHGHRSMRLVHRLVQDYAQEHELACPSYAVVRQICQALPPDLVCLARNGEQAWRAQFELVSRHESLEPNQRWQIDHCHLDILVVDDDQHQPVGRPWLTLVLDTFSRAVTGYHLSLDTPSSQSVCLALRQAIATKPHPIWPMCGIPDQLHLDNGKDFTSRRLEQVAADLGIELLFATPYLARAKGKIERFFGVLNDQLWCELPGYVGSNVADRPVLVQPSLTLRELEMAFVRFLLGDYHQRLHSTTGEAPLLRWQRGGWIPHMPTNPRTLDLLLLASEQRMVQRTGIHLFRLWYWHESLAELVGRRVIVRYDPQNVATILVYFNQRFVCCAQAPELTGLVISQQTWRALQLKQRRSIGEVLVGYRTWLTHQRGQAHTTIPSPAEIDAMLLVERLIAARAHQGIALFAADPPADAFTTLHEEADYE